MTIFGLFGIILTSGIAVVVEHWCISDEFRISRARMLDQMTLIRQGDIDCLANPDPWFIEELLADADCAAKVQELYIGGDLSDARLKRLRELPNLKRVVFLFADHHGEFLKCLSGMPTIEALTFDHTLLSPHDVEAFGSLRGLKSLSFCCYELQTSELQGISKHPSLEKLAIDKTLADNNLIRLLQSIPHLHGVVIGISVKNENEEKMIETQLREALAGCKVRVWNDWR